MTQLFKIHCDLCNNELRENEMLLNKSIVNFSGKPESKSSLQFKFDGSIRKGELCYKCARNIRNYIEELKEKSA